MRSFRDSRSGNMAVMMALAAVPVLAAVGVAADYGRAVTARSFLQNETDAAALAAAQLGPGGNAAPHLEHVARAAAERYGIEGAVVNGTWLSQSDYRVDVKAGLPLRLLSGVPGFVDAAALSTSATVRVAEPRYVYKPPHVTELDFEAADYNRLYVYCFDPEKANDPRTRGRTDMTPISDNGGTRYTFEMPRCAAGQVMSYRLMNVRNARTRKALWDSPHAERYDYHSDTVLRNGVERYDLDGWDILETVLCRNLRECRPQSQGGIIPEGRERTPQRADRACAPGMFMYYGWEDRPPGRGWTDRDYDDIRVVIECPELEAHGERQVRLIR